MINLPSVDSSPPELPLPNIEEEREMAEGTAVAGPVDGPLRVNLSAYWKLDEAGDYSVSRHDSIGTEHLVSGGTTAIASVAGLLNNAVNFNAFSASAGMVHTDDAIVGAGAGVSFSIAGWVKQKNAGGGSTVAAPGGVFVGKWKNVEGGGDATSQDYALSVTNDGGTNRLHLSVRDSGGVVRTIDHATAIVIGTWYHFAFGYDDVAKLIWLQLNGGTRLTAACNGVQRTAQQFSLLSNGASLPADITLDEVGLWHRSLTIGNVATLYNLGTPLALAAFYP